MLVVVQSCALNSRSMTMSVIFLWYSSEIIFKICYPYPASLFQNELFWSKFCSRYFRKFGQLAMHSGFMNRKTSIIWKNIFFWISRPIGNSGCTEYQIWRQAANETCWAPSVLHLVPSYTQHSACKFYPKALLWSGKINQVHLYWGYCVICVVA